MSADVRISIRSEPIAPPGARAIYISRKYSTFKLSKTRGGSVNVARFWVLHHFLQCSLEV